MAALTLSQLGRLISDRIAGVPELRDVWVVAELSNVSGAKGTHWYMDLIEKDQSGNNLARLKAMMWADRAGGLNRKLYNATQVWFKDGIKVMIRGQVNYHPAFGMSFVISDVEPSYTMGEMERIRREILETLTKEGLINRNKSLPLPSAPQRIAVISAEGAAGYGDFVHQLASTPEGLVFYTRLFPARLQGDRTAPSVMAAMDAIERHADKWDLIVIIRGGGAASDLNGFDNLELARRVATSPLPVVVGIGHERDRTVLDEIAAVRCKTPTAVAAWLIDTLRAALGRVVELTGNIVKMVENRLNGDCRRLDQLAASVPVQTISRLQEARERLARTAMRLPETASRATATARLRLEQIKGAVSAAADRRLALERERLDKKESLVRVLDPAATLRRGYSITRVDGRALRSAEGLSQGTRIVTTLSEGTIESTI